MQVLDRETGHGGVDLPHGRIEQILDQAATDAGLRKTQYKLWEKAGGSTQEYSDAEEESQNQRESGGGYCQERWAGHDARQRRTEEEMGRTKKRDGGKQMETWKKDQPEEKDFQEGKRQREQATKAQGMKISQEHDKKGCRRQEEQDREKDKEQEEKRKKERRKGQDGQGGTKTKSRTKTPDSTRTTENRPIFPPIRY